jgi:hypothetical protein
VSSVLEGQQEVQGDSSGKRSAEQVGENQEGALSCETMLKLRTDHWFQSCGGHW